MKHSSTWRKLKLLMWKNIMIRRRDWFIFYMELLCPIAIFIIFALSVEYFNIFPKATIEKEQTPPKINLKQLNSNFNVSTKLCYYPAVAFTEGIITKVQSKLKLDDKSRCRFLFNIAILTEDFLCRCFAIQERIEFFGLLCGNSWKLFSFCSCVPKYQRFHGSPKLCLLNKALL